LDVLFGNPRFFKWSNPELINKNAPLEIQRSVSHPSKTTILTPH
jgi:hypothetical protein